VGRPRADRAASGHPALVVLLLPLSAGWVGLAAVVVTIAAVVAFVVAATLLAPKSGETGA
jgi:hypothetical protein